jgi:hypothetical protein
MMIMLPRVPVLTRPRLTPVPETTEKMHLPADVQTACRQLIAAGLPLHVGYTGRQWIIGTDRDTGTGLRVFFTPHVRRGPRQHLQLIIGGRPAKAPDITSAMALLTKEEK